MARNRRHLAWLGIPIAIVGALWGADRLLDKGDTFEVDFGDERPAFAVVDLTDGPSRLHMDAHTAHGRRRIGRDGDGRVFLTYADGRQVECLVGYVTSGADQDWKFWVRNGRCEDEPPPWRTPALPVRWHKASPGAHRPFNCPTTATYSVSSYVCPDGTGGAMLAPGYAYCSDGGVPKIPPIQPAERCKATGQLIHGNPGPCLDRKGRPASCALVVAR